MDPLLIMAKACKISNLALQNKDHFSNCSKTFYLVFFGQNLKYTQEFRHLSSNNIYIEYCLSQAPLLKSSRSHQASAYLQSASARNSKPLSNSVSYLFCTCFYTLFERNNWSHSEVSAKISFTSTRWSTRMMPSDFTAGDKHASATLFSMVCTCRILEIRTI